MRLKNLMVYLFIGFTVTSCIKEEAPNAEADIETCTVPGDVLNRTPHYWRRTNHINIKDRCRYHKTCSRIYFNSRSNN